MCTYKESSYPNYPHPIRLSQWDSQTEIIYECPVCHTNFAHLSHREHYCHNCGLKIIWDNIPLYCDIVFKALYWKLHNNFSLSFSERENKKLRVLEEYVNKFKGVKHG